MARWPAGVAGQGTRQVTPHTDDAIQFIDDVRCVVCVCVSVGERNTPADARSGWSTRPAVRPVASVADSQ